MKALIKKQSPKQGEAISSKPSRIARVSPNPQSPVKGGKPLYVRQDGLTVWGETAQGLPLCCSPRPGKNGLLCESHAVIHPNGRCKKHGGESLPAGPTHPSYTNGKTSRYGAILQGRMRDTFEAVMANPQALVDMSEELGLVKVLLERATSGMFTGIDEVTMERLESIAGKMSTAIEKGGSKELLSLRALCNEVIGIAERGSSFKEQQQEVTRLQRHLSAIAGTELSRRKLEAESLNAAASIMLDVLQAAKENVKDRAALHAISTAVNRNLMRIGITMPLEKLQGSSTAYLEFLPEETPGARPKEEEELIEAEYTEDED